MELIEATKQGDIQGVIRSLEQDVDVNIKNEYDQTPLHLASCKGYLEIVNILLEAGANINAQTEIGNTPLHLASWQGRLENVEVLLRAGANTEIVNVKNEKPKDRAVNKAIFRLFEDYENIPDVKEPECE